MLEIASDNPVADGSSVEPTLLRKLVVELAGMFLMPTGLRNRLLALGGLTVGPGTTIRSRCTFGGASPVSIGQGCYISYQCVFDASAAITICDRVFMAHRVNIVTATHTIGDGSQRASSQLRLPVTIGPGCWVGTDATVLPGITVAEGCVIAAGAVVTADCAADGLYAGVPARRIRNL